MNIAEHLKQLMDERGLTIYSLAQRSDVSWTTIKNLFGRGTNPTVATMEMLCNGLGITMAQFFAQDGKEVHLTAEQQYLLERWNAVSDEEKKLISDMLDVMLGRK